MFVFWVCPFVNKTEILVIYSISSLSLFCVSHSLSFFIQNKHFVFKFIIFLLLLFCVAYIRRYRTMWCGCRRRSREYWRHFRFHSDALQHIQPWGKFFWILSCHHVNSTHCSFCSDSSLILSKQNGFNENKKPFAGFDCNWKMIFFFIYKSPLCLFQIYLIFWGTFFGFGDCESTTTNNKPFLFPWIRFVRFFQQPTGFHFNRKVNFSIWLSVW